MRSKDGEQRSPHKDHFEGRKCTAGNLWIIDVAVKRYSPPCLCRSDRIQRSSAGALGAGGAAIPDAILTDVLLEMAAALVVVPSPPQHGPLRSPLPSLLRRAPPSWSPRFPRRQVQGRGAGAVLGGDAPGGGAGPPMGGRPGECTSLLPGTVPVQWWCRCLVTEAPRIFLLKPPSFRDLHHHG